MHTPVRPTAPTRAFAGLLARIGSCRLALAATRTLALSGAWLGLGLGAVLLAPASQAQPAACPALLQHSFPRLQDDKPQALCQYAGRVLLVVNTASYCGFTHQYEGLEALHARFAAGGLVVMGFPSNDFGQQEPGSSQQIADLCFNTYGVKFPMFAKTVVKGPGANPLYRQLAQATGQVPAWNFHKYLVDRQGKPVTSFASGVSPTSPELVAAVEKALAAR
jgi:glutathione peroxidase